MGGGVSIPSPTDVTAPLLSAVVTIGRTVKRTSRTALRTFGFAGEVLIDGDLRRRFMDLLDKGLGKILVTLATPHGLRPDDSERVAGREMAEWMVSAGGFFPKLAQVLSVRSDLVPSVEVRELLSQVQERCPAKDVDDVYDILWAECPQTLLYGLGESIAAGSVAQVNILGDDKVVKVAWEDCKELMRMDFRIFCHTERILDALDLEDRVYREVEKMLGLMRMSAESTYLEFDMERERRMMEIARVCFQSRWKASWVRWAEQVDVSHAPLLRRVRGPFLSLLESSHGPDVRIPDTFPDLAADHVLVQQRVAGKSVGELMASLAARERERDAEDRAVAPLDPRAEEAAGPQAEERPAEEMELVLLWLVMGIIIPLQGFMLFVTSEDFCAHTDPHPGNFKYDTSQRVLWLLDWGSSFRLDRQLRRNLCRLVVTLAAWEKGRDRIERADISDCMRLLDFEGDDLAGVAIALFMCEGPSRQGRVGDAHLREDPLVVLNGVDDVPEGMVMLIRAIGIITGLLRGVRDAVSRRVRRGDQGNWEREGAEVAEGLLKGLSLAQLWLPFAVEGLEQDPLEVHI